MINPSSQSSEKKHLSLSLHGMRLQCISDYVETPREQFTYFFFLQPGQ